MEIKVDGINVAECKYFNEYYCHNKKLKFKTCKSNKNCNFKKGIKNYEL